MFVILRPHLLLLRRKTRSRSGSQCRLWSGWRQTSASVCDMFSDFKHAGMNRRYVLQCLCSSLLLCIIYNQIFCSDIALYHISVNCNTNDTSTCTENASFALVLAFMGRVLSYLIWLYKSKVSPPKHALKILKSNVWIYQDMSPFLLYCINELFYYNGFYDSHLFLYCNEFTCLSSDTYIVKISAGYFQEFEKKSSRLI